MSSKRQRGKLIFDKLIRRDSFDSQEAFEAKIKEISSKIKKSWFLCKNSCNGNAVVKVHRNKHGARIIAYDYKKS